MYVHVYIDTHPHAHTYAHIQVHDALGRAHYNLVHGPCQGWVMSLCLGGIRRALLAMY